MSGNFEQGKQFFLTGLAHYQAGRFEQAERDFSAALSLVPGRPSTLTNLGATRIKLGRFGEALQLLDEALAAEPGNAQALGQSAVALAELGRPAAALERAERSLALDAGQAALWSLRGGLLKDMGRPQEAAQALRQAIALGADGELERFFLAALEGGAAPLAPPAHYVEALFDSYSEGFDQHLVEVLNYRAPQVLVQGLQQMNRRFASALDLGCGTGLCGRLLRPLAQRLEGVDLSENMVAAARAAGCYDALAQADLVEHLAGATGRHDLLVAADVFIYVGALEAVFAAAAGALQPGGVFCFSVEEGAPAHDLSLRPSARYAHSARSIEALAARHGFELGAMEAQPLREDQREPVPGLYYWLLRR
ncbi:MAG TPA: tetratricopeptide repeat protein [Ramlibacter sp.]|nr:tetratricopeptide repeat protein [Ramlibacter sp.]